jgi:hypothetical protein
LKAQIVPRWLVELAERKLGKGATVRESHGEWIAERSDRSGRTKATGGSRDILVWFLEQMPDTSNSG